MKPYKRAADGLWCVAIELPRHDGKRRRKVIVNKDRNQVIRQRNALVRQLETHGDLPSASQTVAQWVNYWLDNIHAKKNRPKTLANDRSLTKNYIVPTIGNVRLDKLTPAHVRRVHAAVLAKGKSSTTALRVHAVLSSAFKAAEREGRLNRNPAELAEKPRRDVTTLDVLTTDEAARLVKLFGKDDPELYLWATFLLTGARRGEVLGLEWDRVTDVLDLSWQLQRLRWDHGCGNKCGRKRGTDCPERRLDVPVDYEYRHLTGGLYLTRPKSRAGWRVIPLVDPLRGILARWETQADTNTHGLVFATPEGEPIDPDAATRMWPDVLKAAGISKKVRIHDLRHTAVDIMYEAGVPEAVIIEIVGHSSRAMTRAYRSRGNRPQLTSAMETFSAKFTQD